MMGLTATVTRGGTTTFDDALTPALAPELGTHYGAVLDDLRSGDVVHLAVDTPPQFARHEGYETAFLDMPPMTVTV